MATTTKEYADRADYTITYLTDVEADESMSDFLRAVQQFFIRHLSEFDFAWTDISVNVDMPTNKYVFSFTSTRLTTVIEDTFEID